jgi:amino acid efflux transporter
MKTTLPRHIGSKELLAYYISSVVGVGVLIIPGIAAQIAGPASLLSWICLALICAPFAIAFSQMAILVPDSGGVPAFVEQKSDVIFGRSLAILLSISMVIGNPVLGLASAHYLHSLLGFEETWTPWVGFGFMVFSVGFNLLGIRIGSRIQSFALFSLITGLILIVLLSFPKVDLRNMTPFFPHGVESVGTAMVVCLFSFLGWENVSSIAEEVKQPERTFRRVIPWAIACVGGLYIAIAWVYLSVVPEAARQNDPTVITPILRIVFGGPVAVVGGAIALVLLVLTTNSWVLGASRQVYALARNGVLPTGLVKVARVNGAPVNALLFMAVCYGLITLLLVGTGWSEQWLIKVANANFMLIYLGAFAVAVRVFSGWMMKVCAGISILATASFIPFFGWIMLGSVVLLSCIYCWFYWQDRRGVKQLVF